MSRASRYFPDFLTESEAERVMNIVERNPWSESLMQRRQQFYGDVYYHTRQELAAIQPDSEPVG